ncbi:apolipoprotein N-acyltransferase [Hyalangium gracile]|uniref:apolipoprotein N-acyltransferase n=1 Tax=Hyalangium gracile TaxID=394092 RepID=UPI001CCFBA15|nr:apolipoprotein N-acyltransferase [Hyalangium gracile]
MLTALSARWSSLPEPWKPYVLAGVGGLLVGASAHLLWVFPANVLGLVAGFACYFRALARCPAPRVGLRAGAVFGVTLAASTLYWITDVLYVLTPTERIVGGGVVGGFLLLIALPYGLWGWASSRLSRSALAPWLPVLHAPGLVLTQALIHDAWLGFPWLHYGYWMALGPLGHWLAVLGAQGAGLLPLWVAAGLGLWSQTPRAVPIAGMAAALLGLGLLLPTRWTTPADVHAVTIATVTLPSAGPGDSVRDDLSLLSQYVAATREARADWVVWPESVIRDGGANLQPLAEVLGPQGGPVFAGALLPAPAAGRYNALVELRGGQPVYYKQKLVPFSEYVPSSLLRSLFAALELNTLKTNVSAWRPPQRAFEASGASVRPLLCYEVAFTELVTPDERPQVLLNAGNEHWFRRALLHRMTLAMGVARSREYGLPLVRAVTEGHSGTFDPDTAAWSETTTAAGPAMLHRARMTPRPATTPYSRWRRLWSPPP